MRTPAPIPWLAAGAAARAGIECRLAREAGPAHADAIEAFARQQRATGRGKRRRAPLIGR